MSETIIVKISSYDVVRQLSVQEIVLVLRKNGQLQELADEVLDTLDVAGRKRLFEQLVSECLSTEEIIEAVGADVIVEECSEQIEHEQANVHASREEDAHLIYEKDGL